MAQKKGMAFVEAQFGFYGLRRVILGKVVCGQTLQPRGIWEEQWWLWDHILVFNPELGFIPRP